MSDEARNGAAEAVKLAKDIALEAGGRGSLRLNPSEIAGIAATIIGASLIANAIRDLGEESIEFDPDNPPEELLALLDRAAGPDLSDETLFSDLEDDIDEEDFE